MAEREPEDVATRAPVEDQGISVRTWGICGLMLLATMLNYMDRQALAQQATDIRSALALSSEDYGWLETGFGLAFAVGGIMTGTLADRVSLRWLYPAILLGWSAVGFLTGWVTSYRELLLCRVMLGFFEAGQWPCALAASQRLLTRRQRTMGNSILQSGASLGAIATPQVILLLNQGGPGGWRLPFQVVGAAGLVWIAAWLMAIRPQDLQIAPDGLAGGMPDPAPELAGDSLAEVAAKSDPSRETFIRRFLVLVVVVITINLCWQYFRAWMPMMLEEQYGYTKDQTQNFSSLYYIVAGIGCILVGLLVKWLAAAGWTVHRARMAAFTVCVLLTAVSALTSMLPASGLLLVSLLAIGFGSLGQFPAYYAFTQELSVRQMGKITGVLSFLTWTSTALAQSLIGRWIHRTGSYTEVTFLAGLVPLLGWLGLALFWNARSRRPSTL